MKILLKNIEPNPHRNYDHYKIDPDRVDILRESIRSTDWWENIIVRPHPAKKGKYQQAFGHHGLSAAIAEGIKSADLQVWDIDDMKMLRMMSQENSTQRGNNPNAILDSVEAAQKEMAYLLLKHPTLKGFASYGNSHRTPPFENQNGYAKARSNVLEGNGVGHETCRWACGWQNEKGMLDVVREANAQLKASGRVGIILGEVKRRLQAEAEAAEKERKRLEKEAEAAAAKAEADAAAEAEAEEAAAAEAEAKGEAAAAEAAARSAEEAASKASTVVTFDDSCKDVLGQTALKRYREWVTGKLKDLLPVENQLPLAKHIVQVANDYNDGSVGRRFVDLICEGFMKQADQHKKKTSEQRLNAYLKSSPFIAVSQKWRATEEHINRVWNDMTKLIELLNENPDVRIQKSDTDSARVAVKDINKMWKKFENDHLA